MAKNEKPAGMRIERSVFERAEATRKTELKKGNPAALSPQGWFSYLVRKGLDVISESD